MVIRGAYVAAVALASLAALAAQSPLGEHDAPAPTAGIPPGPGAPAYHPQGGAGDPAKFDDGFYGKVAGLAGRAEAGRWQPEPIYQNTVVVVAKYGGDGRDVSGENKGAVVEMLRQAGARNIEAAETLSLVTASIPAGGILELSERGQVYRLGDGDAASHPAIDTMRRTIGADDDDLRRPNGTVADGSGITVGIVDDGVNHPQGVNGKIIDRTRCDDLVCRTASAEDVYGPDPGGPEASHGTLVALVIAGSGLSGHNGIAPGVGILDAQVMRNRPTAGDPSIAHALASLLRDGADVSNLSQGTGKCRDGGFGETRQLITGEAVDNGMVVVVSAGNDGSYNGGRAPVPVYQSINEWGCTHNVITVGGIDDRSPGSVEMYANSGRGPAIHLVDGVAHPVLKPEIVAPAVLQIPGYTANDTAVTARGTSFSAPAVSAAAALALQEREMEPAAVKVAILLGANWTGPVPCTSVQYERDDAADNCSHGRQPGGSAEANGAGSLEIINNVGFGILDVGSTLDYITQASGRHLVEDSLDSDGDVDGYIFEVTDAGRPVKIILSWTVDPFYGTGGDLDYQDLNAVTVGLSLDPSYEPFPHPRGEQYFADLGFDVDCPGMDTISAQSAYQSNEFAVFMPAEAGTCTVAVTGSGIDTPLHSEQDYALASTLPLDAVDIDRPAPSISTAEPSPTSADRVAFSVDFGEPVDAATFGSSDVSASGGTVSAPAPAAGTAREFTFEVYGLAEGNLTVSIPEGAVLDPAGNSNTASDPYVMLVERTRPSPSISTAEPSPTSADRVAFSVDFGEPVDAATFGSSDVSASGGTVSAPAPAAGTAREFTFEVYGLAAGNLTVSIPEGAVLDPAGNSNTASDPYVMLVERPRPSPSISTAEPSPTSADRVAFSVDFGEPVDAATFGSSDVSASGGTVSAPAPAAGTAREFTFEVYGLAAGNLTVSIPEGAVLDPAGNSNTASDPYVMLVERTRPSPSISTAEPSPTSADRVAFSVDFGEPVDAATFGSSDVSASGGTVSAPAPAAGTAREFTFEVYGLAAGNLTVSIPEGAVLDPAGNSNTASNLLALTVTAAPAGTAPDAAFVTTWQTTGDDEYVVITVGDAAGTYTVTWGDASVDTDVSGDSSHVYESPGTYTVSIYGDLASIHLPHHPANALKLKSIEQWGDIRWRSMSGAFAGASNMVYRATDAPDLSAVTDASGMFRFASQFNGSLSDWDVSSVTDMSRMFSGAGAFNGDISGWNVSAAADMSEMLLVAGSFARNLGGWYIVLDDTTISAAGDALPIRAQNAWLDGRGPAYAVDESAEGGGLFVVADGALAVKAGLDPAPGSYNVTITARGVLGEGAGAATHSRTVLVTVGGDSSPPAPLWAAYHAANGTLAIAFSEPLNGTVHLDRLHIRDAGRSGGSGGVTLAGAAPSVDGRSLAVTLTGPQRASLADLAAPQLDIDAGAVSDASGNPIAASAGNPIAVRDTTGPAPSLSTASPSPTSAGSVRVDVDFGEAIDAATFDLGDDVSVTGGTASGLRHVSGNLTFAFTLTPAGDGLVAARIPAGLVSDPAGNANTASNVLEVAFEGAGGSAGGPKFSSAAYSAATGRLSITFSEPLNGTVHYDRLHIRDAGRSEGGIALDGALPGGSSGPTVTATLSARQRADLALMASPQLDIGRGAVYGVGGSGIAAATADLAIEVAADEPEAPAAAVESITKGSPEGRITGSGDVVFHVNFSRPVTGVDRGDFVPVLEEPLEYERSAYSSTPSAPIPFGTTIRDAVAVGRPGAVASVSVDLDITHSFIGDLRVSLVSPDGTSRALHDRAGAAGQDLRRTYEPDFAGVEAAGDWTLHVRDLDRQDSGVLNGWTVTVSYNDTGAAVTGLTGGGSEYAVAVSAARDGTYGLDVAPDNGIADPEGNRLAGTAPAGEDQSYTVLTGPPTVKSFTRSGGAAQAAPDRLLSFDVSFSEPVAGVDMADFLAVSGDAVTPGRFSQTSAPSLAIPDASRSTHPSIPPLHQKGPGNPRQYDAGSPVLDAISVPDLGPAKAVSVRLNVTHPYASDLRIDLISPDGRAALLHDPAGAGAGGIAGTYAPDLAGARTAGDWTLRVHDLVEADTGVLNEWTLEVGYDDAGAAVTGLTGGGSEYTVTVSAARNGTYGLGIAPYGAVADLAGNPLAALAPTGEDQSYVVDAAALGAVRGYNSPPSVDAGPDQSVNEGETVALSGGATDRDGDGLAYLWTHNATGPAIQLENATSPATSFAAPQVNSTAAVSLTLTATDQHGASASDTAVVTITDIPASPPAAPRNLQATSANATITLTWDDPGDGSITGYKIMSRTPATEDRLSVLVEDTGAPGTSYAVAGLDPETVYVFRIIAINGHGESGASNFVRLSSGTAAVAATNDIPASPPAAPRNLQATSANATITLTWDDPGDGSITGYKIMSRTPATEDRLSVLVEDTGAPGTSYAVAGLDPETVYVFRIIAINGHGESGASNFVRLSSGTAAVAATNDIPASPPAAPRNLQATSANATITLTWDDPGDGSITGYKIMSRTPATEDRLSVLVEDTGAPGTSYAVAGLDPETVYVFRIIAINGHGESGASNFVRLSSGTAAVAATNDIPASPPAAPRNLQATSANATITLTWDDPGDGSITGYKIMSRTPATEDRLSVLVEDTGAPGTSYAVAGLDPETVYVFRIIAINGHGESGASNFVRLSSGTAAVAATNDIPASPPAAPRNLQATSANATITLTWDDPGDGSITGYKIMSRTPATEDRLSVLVEDTGAPGTSYAVAGLDPETVYVFRIIAINGHGESGASNFVRLSTQS